MPVPGPTMMIGVSGFSGSAETVRLLDIDLELVAGLNAIGEEALEARPWRLRLPTM